MTERDAKPDCEPVTLDGLAALGRTLLESLPAHWHDEAVVEFRDAVEEVESRRAVPSPVATGQAAGLPS